MRFLKSHLEWTTFTVGLLLLALMDPSGTGVSFCLFDLAGIEYCPGKGLGHSIAYTFRGDFEAALKVHFAGPFAVLILSSRIIFLWNQLLHKSKT
ncbi:MAG: DUF2752 domain-containing protein [Balneolaceae bacterium]